jgi:PAS domain S-box-containing protein
MSANAYRAETSAARAKTIALGDAIRMYRTKRRLTQGELAALLKADRVEIDQAYLSRVENNEIRPRAARLAAICSQLECTTSDLEILAQELATLSQRRDAINSKPGALARRPVAAANENVSAYQIATLAAHVGIWRFDFDARTLWLSVSSRALVDDKIISADWKDYVVPQDHVIVRKAILGALRTAQQAFDCFARVHAPSNTQLMVRIAGKIERGIGRRALSISGAIVPVSDSQLVAMHAIDSIKGCFIFAKNRDLQFTFVNQALVEAFGKKSKSELLGKTDLEIHPHPEEVRFFNQMDQRAIDLFDQQAAGRAAGRGENHRLAIDEEFLTDSQGVRRVLATVKEPILMPNNEVHIFGIATDVTEKRHLQALFDMLMNHVGDTGDVICFKDKNLRFIRANRAMANLAGVTSPDELIGKCDYDFFPREYADEWRNEEELVLASGVPSVNKLCQNQMRDGSIVWRMVSKYPVKDAEGNVCELIGITKDITELVVARDRLRFESQLFDQVVNNPKAPFCIWVKDITGRYIKSNKKFAVHHNYRHASEIIGKTDFDHWPREIAERYSRDDKAVVETKSPKLCYQERQQWDGGRESLILTSKFPVLDSYGAVVAILGMYEVLQDNYQPSEMNEMRSEEARIRMNQHLKKIESALSDQGLCISL